MPSSISPERIKELNRLAFEAEVKDGSGNSDMVDEGCMMSECLGLIEALEVATDFDCQSSFHENKKSI